MKTIKQRQAKAYTSIYIKKAAFILALGLCTTPWVTSPAALVAGFLFTHFLGHPFLHLNHKATNWLLKASVVGLGFSMNLQNAVVAGQDGLLLTLGTIAVVLTAGFLLGRLLHINARTAHLLASGTAICGGSAIAAVAPVIDACEKEISVSLGTVFLLNSVALLVFPPLGHFLGLTQHQFGLWAAVAIHDTSSVVGAAAAYGQQALEVATVVKLARALWIIPVSLLSAILFCGKNKKISIPWFIGLFVLAMLANSYLPYVASFNQPVTTMARAALVATLFLIGSGLSVEKIRAVGWRPLVLGLGLWVLVSVVSLLVIM
ncbi:YeiH family protein [Pontibacter kalidii]|uniref:YeiH family protein n=1 Tax=Pontibacter kalidii TaxID=2592049 RepID=UPI002259FE7E|nr:putative sulfate exporter family transporter [Pontibacter kalidii]